VETFCSVHFEERMWSARQFGLCDRYCWLPLAVRNVFIRKPASLTQAGRYIADFRAYSEKYSFRERSETPEIAVELSLQPWRKFGVDGVIMFSGTVVKQLACMFEIIISTSSPFQIY
jgi:hypothetical protein